jgi:hypothetical protein
MLQKGYVRSVFVAWFISVPAFLFAVDAKDFRKWESFDFAQRELKLSQIKDLSPVQLKYLRGIVFGRRGRVFKEKVIQDWLQTRSWYKPNPKYHVSQLNDTERHNMDVIKEAEHLRHKFIEPGDLKFYRNRLITEKQLGTHTQVEWKIMRAEVEAIHGKRFDDEPWLQAFFDERYWYQPKKKYHPKVLNKHERKNVETMTAVMKKQLKLTLSPGDMGKYQSKLITEEMLHGLSLYELRLLRNEVYARRGRHFRTMWLDLYFRDRTWYHPLPNPVEPKLSSTETKNIATIVKYERKIHEELSTKPVSQNLLEGLFLEDARKLRNEIYARRGKVFKDKWLNSYFTSFDWYKPDPKFSEKSLSGVERKNVAAILAYERDAESAMRQVAA